MQSRGIQEYSTCAKQNQTAREILLDYLILEVLFDLVFLLLWIKNPIKNAVTAVVSL